MARQVPLSVRVPVCELGSGRLGLAKFYGKHSPPRIRSLVWFPHPVPSIPPKRASTGFWSFIWIGNRASNRLPFVASSAIDNEL